MAILYVEICSITKPYFFIRIPSYILYKATFVHLFPVGLTKVANIVKKKTFIFPMLEIVDICPLISTGVHKVANIV